MKFVTNWLFSVFAWMSQTVNLFLFFGHHDMTISCRCYLNRHSFGWRFLYHILNGIFFWQEDHCYSSYVADVKFARQILKQ